MPDALRSRVVVLCGLLGGLTLACGPRASPTGPGAGGSTDGAVLPDPAAAQAECERTFEAALVERTARALAQVDERAVRGAVVLEAMARTAAASSLVTGARGLATAVLADPAVRDQLMQAALQSSGDAGVLLSWGAQLFSGVDVEQRLRQVLERVQTALGGAVGEGDLAPRLMTLPPVAELLAVLFPAEAFAAPLAQAQSSLAQSRSVADAKLRLIVPEDPEATRRAVEDWAGRPAGIGCQPLVRRFGLAEAIADLTSSRDVLEQASGPWFASPVVREETIALARDLMADANFRLALDELFVRAMRDDSDADVLVAARAVVASTALPQAVGQWAGRVVGRQAELPDLRDDLAVLADDPELASVLQRWLDILVMSDGCVEL